MGEVADLSAASKADDSGPRIKVQGLPRVGSNYLQKLLEINFQAQVLGAEERGWKHGPCPAETGIRYVFLSRDPYSWVISFHHWERIHERSTATDLETFLQQPITHPKLAEAWGKTPPLEAWNRAGRSWLGLDARTENPAVYLRYEDLINDLDQTLGHVEQALRLIRRENQFIDVPERADSWKTKNPRKTLDVAYYRDKRYLEDHTPNTRAMLREGLDAMVLRALGYSLYD